VTEQKSDVGLTKVARIEEIPQGHCKVVTVHDRPIAVFNVQGTFYAIYNKCPHEGGPLGEGRVKGHVVACPWHDLSFDLRSGVATDGGGYCVGSYQVIVKEDEVFVGGKRPR
jgi:nitrite reductase (NADH) small subunit